MRSGAAVLVVALTAGCATHDRVHVDDAEFCEQGVLQEGKECTVAPPPEELEGETPEIRDPDEFAIDRDELREKARELRDELRR